LAPRALTDPLPDFIEIASMSRRKIIEPPYLLAQPEQGLDQIRADETRGSGNQPLAFILGKPRAQVSLRFVLYPYRQIHIRISIYS
jgi:hypothetical protein